MPASGSRPRSATERLRRTAAKALSGSRLAAAARSGTARIGRYVRASFLYRWLTAEPDPDVIVIDLRDTWTVGPFLAVLDRLVSGLARGFDGSRAGAVAGVAVAAIRSRPLRVVGVGTTAVGGAVVLGTLLTTGATTGLTVGAVAMLAGVVLTRDERDWETLRETRAVDLLRRALEPPEPPDRAAEDVDDDARTASDDARTTSDDEERP